MSYEILHGVERFCSAFGPPLVALAVGGLGIWIARGQKRIAQYQADLAAEKLRRELYDRRFAILEAMQAIFSMVEDYPFESETAQFDKFLRFRSTIEHGRFLLDEELYLHLIEQVNTSLLLMIEYDVRRKVPAEDRLAKFDEESIRYSREVTDLGTMVMNLPAKFEPYLRPRNLTA